MAVQALRGPTSLCGSVLSSWSILYPHTPQHGSLLFSKPFQRNSHLRGLGPGHVGTQCEQGLCRLWALGPQAESPPPEVFFLGRVFSVLEASGCGKEGGRQSAQPGVTTPSASPQTLAGLSPQLWALF